MLRKPRIEEDSENRTSSEDLLVRNVFYQVHSSSYVYRGSLGIRSQTLSPLKRGIKKPKSTFDGRFYLNELLKMSVARIFKLSLLPMIGERFREWFESLLHKKGLGLLENLPLLSGIELINIINALSFKFA